ncbi:MAG: response regulator transcription factor [Candidatus Omnitrophica bacterium]|nr:response regulator transcription factor [Candidatus Omnitrophota bacterium]
MLEKRKILVVEDEKELAKLITFHITTAGYDVLCANNGIEAMEICETENPALVVLDIMLPRLDGWQVCRRLRQDPRARNIPIIILSALSEVKDKLKGFDLGADDYVTKPFSPRELVVRIKRVLSRFENKPLALNTTVKIGSLEIDRADFTVKRNNEEVALTEKERGILRLLMDNTAKVFGHSEILDTVWGQDNIVEYGNVDVHIRHLREKIEKNPEAPQLIKTVKGKGYKFEL